MVNFNVDNWMQIKETYGKWWNNKLESPILPMIVRKDYSGSKPKAPILSQKTCTDFSWSATEIIEALDYSLSGEEYYGGAFPLINFESFGPGVVAAFCGAELDNTSGNVWFNNTNKLSIETMHIEYNPNNKWITRIKDIYHAGNKKWNGNVIMGMPDLGGILDIAAVFCGAEDLLMYLYDEPDEIKRLCAEIQKAWFAAYHDLMEILGEHTNGYTDWSQVYSEKPLYISQSDITYMISTDMFRKFVLGDLRYAFKKIDHNIYHLDGVGQLSHLDDILEIDGLNAVQWVAGASEPSASHWIEVYQKIKSKNKSLFLTYGDFYDLKIIVEAVGCRNIYMPLGVQDKQSAINILNEVTGWV